MDISEAIGVETDFFVLSVFCGMGLVWFYDFFRIVRRIFPHGNIWIGIEDICYWGFCTVAVFILLYQKNDGMLRAFCFLGIALGGTIYTFLLSKYMVKICVVVFGTIVRFFGKIFRFMLSPFIKMGKKMIAFIRKWLKKLCKAIKSIWHLSLLIMLEQWS